MTYTLAQINTIAVAGAGTMGAGIAQLSAMAGYRTILYDLHESALQNGLEKIGKNLDGAIKRNKILPEAKTETLNRITTTTNIDNLQAELVIEAILEKLDPKIALFTKLATINPASTILATNTSSIPVTRIAAAIPHPERVVGMHFFNPAHIMKLVEVISGAATDPQVAQTINLLAENMGKKAVMAKDAPGFIVNRVARQYYLESFKLLEEQVANVENIDAILQSCGFRMGPFRLLDLIGIDTNFAVTQSMFESFHYEERFRPNRLQQQKVEAGHHGRKTGKGFYEYGE